MQFRQGLPEAGLIGVELDGPLEPVERVGQLALPAQDQPHVRVGLGEVGGEPQGLEVGRTCLDEPIEGPERIAEIVVVGRDVRLEGHGLPAVDQRVFGLAAVDEHLAEVRPGRGELRVQLHGAAEVLEGLVAQAGFAQGDAEIVVGRCELGAQLQGASELLDRLLASPQALQRQAEVRQCLREIRPQAERGTAAADGSIHLTETPVHLGEIGVEGRDVRSQGHGPADQLDGLRVVPLLVIQHAEQVEGGRVRLFPRQDLSDKAPPPGRTDPPGASRWRLPVSLAW